MLDMVAFDADDTLWHNEPHFLHTHEKFTQLLAKYHEPDWIERRLIETEIRNLKHFGYGIKGFTLSMIETAIELTEGRITGEEIQQVLNFGKAMLKAPLELLDGVIEAVEAVGKRYEIMIITKGDLFDQETKIARSGMADRFKYVEILSEKKPENYQRLLRRYGLVPERFLMIGNSPKSDVLPILELGGHAIHIPYKTTWEHELISKDEAAKFPFPSLTHISELPTYLEKHFPQ